MFEKTKINKKKEAGVGPFLKKTIICENESKVIEGITYFALFNLSFHFLTGKYFLLLMDKPGVQQYFLLACEMNENLKKLP